MKKVEALISGIRKLARAGELDRESMMEIGKQIGIYRHDTFGFGGGGETDAEYFKRVRGVVSGKEGFKELECRYDALSNEERRAIGRTVNQERIKYS